MALVAMAELAMTAFLINEVNEQNHWPTPGYRSLLIFFCFNAAWTTLFATAYVLWIIDGAVHILASIASSVMWLLVTTLLWGVAARFMHVTRTGGNCAGVPTITRCRQALTVEALGWTELGLSLMTLLATCFWVRKNRRRSYVNDSRRLV